MEGQRELVLKNLVAGDFPAQDFRKHVVIVIRHRRGSG
jgi:hypothetical protein